MNKILVPLLSLTGLFLATVTIYFDLPTIEHYCWLLQTLGCILLLIRCHPFNWVERFLWLELCVGIWIVVVHKLFNPAYLAHHHALVDKSWMEVLYQRLTVAFIGAFWGYSTFRLFDREFFRNVVKDKVVGEQIAQKLDNQYKEWRKKWFGLLLGEWHGDDDAD